MRSGLGFFSLGALGGFGGLGALTAFSFTGL
jgi:hypothetical protein